MMTKQLLYIKRLKNIFWIKLLFSFFYAMKIIVSILVFS